MLKFCIKNENVDSSSPVCQQARSWRLHRQLLQAQLDAACCSCLAHLQIWSTLCSQEPSQLLPPAMQHDWQGKGIDSGLKEWRVQAKMVGNMSESS